MNYEVIIMPAAEAELEQAYLWLAQRAPERDAFDHDIRQLLYGKHQHAYRILFDVVGQTVRVLHIRHGARQRLEP